MLGTIKRSLTGLAIAVSLALPLVMSQPSHALFENSVGQAQCGANLEGGTPAGCEDKTNSEAKASSTLQTLIGLLAFVVGVASVIALILAGFKFITAQGDAGSVKSARDTAVYAIIGLIVAAVAQGVVKLVLGKL